MKAFGDRECTDTKSESFKNPLEYHKDYSPYACMVECHSHFIQEACNCSQTFAFGKNMSLLQLKGTTHQKIKMSEKTLIFKETILVQT